MTEDSDSGDRMGRGNGERPPRRIAWSDIRVAVVVATTLLMAWVVPERYWLSMSRKVAAVVERFKHERHWRTRWIQAITGDVEFHIQPSQWEHRVTLKLLERLQLMRCYRPDGWRPRIKLEGRDHVDAAIAAGKGAILWFEPSAFSTVVSKMAFHHAGFRLHYVSRWIHNLSRTVWGARILNPVNTSVENRFLAERLVIWPGKERETFDALSKRVSDGCLVGITIYDMGRRTMTVPFFQQEMRIATAPAALALKYGAPLIPVFTVREADGDFTVTISPPLEGGAADDMQQAISNMLIQYSGLAESYALRHPDQFWWHGVPTPADLRDASATRQRRRSTSNDHE